MSISPIPAAIGSLLWAGAIALLLEDAWHSGHLTVTHALQPLLTAATVASAVYVHRSHGFARLAFFLLAILGSLVVVLGTMGRQAEGKDSKHAQVSTGNATRSFKEADLLGAKANAARECKVRGPRCKEWEGRVDALTRELAGLVPQSADPRADAIARLATLLGANGERVKAIVAAVDPWLLPLTIEFASICFFAIAFPHSRNRPQPSATTVQPIQLQARSLSQGEALRQFRRMSTASRSSFVSHFSVANAEREPAI